MATHSDVSCSPIPRSQICDFMPYYTMGISCDFMVFLMQAYICDAAASPLAMNNDMIVGRWASTPTLQNPQTEVARTQTAVGPVANFGLLSIVLFLQVFLHRALQI